MSITINMMIARARSYRMEHAELLGAGCLAAWVVGACWDAAAVVVVVMGGLLCGAAGGPSLTSESRAGRWLAFAWS